MFRQQNFFNQRLNAVLLYPVQSRSLFVPLATFFKLGTQRCVIIPSVEWEPICSISHIFYTSDSTLCNYTQHGVGAYMFRQPHFLNQRLNAVLLYPAWSRSLYVQLATFFKLATQRCVIIPSAELEPICSVSHIFYISDSTLCYHTQRGVRAYMFRQPHFFNQQLDAVLLYPARCLTLICNSYIIVVVARKLTLQSWSF